MAANKTFTLIAVMILMITTSGVSAQDVSMEANGGTLHGVFTMAADGSADHAVLIVAGSGPTDRNGNNPQMINNSLKMLSDMLNGNSFATFRFDKRGVAASQGAMTSEADLRFEGYVDDVVLWANYIKNKFGIKKLYLLGHSEGALIVTLAAKELDVEKVILLAAPARKASDIIRDQLGASGLPAEMLAQANAGLDKLEDGQLAENTPPALASIFRASVQPYLISWFAYDPAIEAASLTVPVKIIMAENDIQVAVSEADVFKAQSSALKIDVIAGMNHVLKNAPMDRAQNIMAYTNPDLPLAEGLSDSVIGFLKSGE